MANIRYAENDFWTMRMENQLFADNSLVIRILAQRKSKHILFCRPPRFGKSLLLSMLQWYHDENTTAEQFGCLFNQLEISKDQECTDQEARKYKVLMLRLCPDISPTDDETKIRAQFTTAINGQFKDFQCSYKDVKFEIDPTSCAETLQNLFRELNKQPSSRLLLLIDEYDQVANILLQEPEGYDQNVTNKLHVLKNFFVRLKSLQNTVRFAKFRSVAVGVFPLALAALSGFNVFDDLSKFQPLSTALGFTEQHVVDFLRLTDSSLSDEQTKRMVTTLRHYYNGYLFTGTDASYLQGRLFNPQMVVFFLKQYEDVANLKALVRDRDFYDWTPAEHELFVTNSDFNPLPTGSLYDVLCRVPVCTVEFLERVLAESDSIANDSSTRARRTSRDECDSGAASAATACGEPEPPRVAPMVLAVQIIDVRRGVQAAKLNNRQYLLWLMYHHGMLTFDHTEGDLGTQYVLRLPNQLARDDFAHVLLRLASNARSLLRAFWEAPDKNSAFGLLQWIIRHSPEHWTEDSLQRELVSSMQTMIRIDGSMFDPDLMVTGSFHLQSGKRSGGGRDDHECDILMYSDARRRLIHLELKHVLAADLVVPPGTACNCNLREFRRRTQTHSDAQVLALLIDSTKQKKYNLKSSTKARTPAELLEHAHEQLRVRARIYQAHPEWRSFNLKQFAVIEVGDRLIIEEAK